LIAMRLAGKGGEVGSEKRPSRGHLFRGGNSSKRETEDSKGGGGKGGRKEVSASIVHDLRIGRG